MNIIFKSVLMVLHLLLALVICVTMIILPKNINHLLIQYWAKRLLRILKIKITLTGEVLKFLGKDSYLVVSNHISWLDIPVIFSLKPITFVSASDVKTWPIIGMLAKISGAIFIDRNHKSNLPEVIQAMNFHFKNKKQSVCIFPEGTSTDGESVRPFKPNLFESAVVANVPVYSLAIRYLSKSTGKRSNVPAFIGDMGLLESMAQILKNRNLIVELTFFPPPGSAPEMPSDRKWLALHSHEQISRYLVDKS